MINSILSRLGWVFYRRDILKIKHKGFYASPLSFIYKNCSFSDYNTIMGASVLYNTHLGKFKYINNGTVSNSTIGSFTSIGPNSKIDGFGNHPMKWISTHPVFYNKTPLSLLTFSDGNYFKKFLPVNGFIPFTFFLFGVCSEVYSNRYIIA